MAAWTARVYGWTSLKSGEFWRITPDGKRTRIPTKQTGMRLDKGDIVEVRTPGSGGYGDPKSRDPQRVLQDVQEALVSPESARADYGVAIVCTASGDFALDEAGTAALRSH